MIIVSVRILCVSLHRLKSFPVVGGWVVGGPKVIIVSVRVLYAGLRKVYARFTQTQRFMPVKKVFRWVVGGPKVIIVSVRVLYVRFTQVYILHWLIVV